MTMSLTVAMAQEPSEPTVQPETAPQPPTQTPSETQPVDVAPETAPPPPLPPPETKLEDPTKKPITVNAWVRVGGTLQGTDDKEKLDKLAMSGVFELHTDGAITENIGVTANLVGEFATDDGNGTVQLLDVIGRFDIIDPFHIWVGRMLVPVDRANFSGDWFAAPWTYAGSFAGLDAMPKEGPNGRNDGVTVWGQFGGGLLKYYASAFDLYDPDTKPLWSGRINLSLLNPEPGYYHSSTYYGEKDVLAIAIGAQHKKDGSIGMGMPADDYSEFNADILFEKNLKRFGTIDLEGAFYKYEGDNQTYDWSDLLLASYLTEGKIGPGKLQPLVRFQQAKPKVGDTASCFEAQLGYVIASYAARLALGYRYTENTEGNGTKGNAIYLGAQFMK